MTYVRWFQLMYLECQKDPTWNDSNIFAITWLADILEMIHQQTSQHSSNPQSSWDA
jgi:hypothetical protein